MVRQGIMAIALLLGLGASEAAARTWNSASGVFKIEAELIEKRADGTVVLKRTDGATIQTKAEKLSKADQDYIRQWTPGGEAANGGEVPKAEDAAENSGSALSAGAAAAVAKIKSAEAKAAVKEYEGAEKKLSAAQAAKQKEYREKLAGMLEDGLKEATTAGNLDDALAIRNAIKALGTGEEPVLAGAGAKTRPAPEEAKARPVPDSKKNRLDYPVGTWTIFYTNGAARTYRFVGKTALWLDNQGIRGQMYVQDGNLLLDFNDGKIERLQAGKDSLTVEHWLAKGNFLSRAASATGTGKMQKK